MRSDTYFSGKLYESDVTFSPKNFPYNADVLPVWANKIGALQTSNRHGPLQISNRYNPPF
jgi:hypothetical protein